MIKKIFFIVIVVFMSSCSVSPNAETEIFASDIPEPSLVQIQPTLSSGVTSLPIIIWDKNLPKKQDTSLLYPELETISSQNVIKIEEITRWGLGYVKGIALSPDKSTIAVSTSTGIYLYDRESLLQNRKIDFGVELDTERVMWCKYWLDNIDFSPDGKFLAIGEKEVNIWDLNSNQLRTTIKQPNESPESNVVEVKYNEDGSRIFVSRVNSADYPCVADGRFEIYNANNGKILFQKVIHVSDSILEVYSVKNDEVLFSNGYEFFIVNSVSGELVSEGIVDSKFQVDLPITLNAEQEDIWKIYRSGQQEICTLSMVMSESAYPEMMDYSKDEMMVITLGRGSGDLNVWDFENCRKSDGFLFFPEPARDIGFSPLGNYLVTGSLNGGHYYVWNALNGESLFPVLSKYLTFNFDESQLYALMEDRLPHLAVLDISTNEVLYQRSHNGSIYSFSLSPMNDNFLLIGNHLVSLPDKKLIKEFDGSALYFSPDGEQIASLSTFYQKPEAYLSFFDITISLPSNIPNQTISYSNDIQHSSINYLYSNFSSDWHYFAAVANEKIIVWDIEKQDIVSEIKTYVDDTVFFSNDGSLLFTRDFRNLDSAIEIWDVKTGNLLKRFLAPLNVWENQGFALSPDGKLLAFLANDYTIRIFGIRKP